MAIQLAVTIRAKPSIGRHRHHGKSAQQKNAQHASTQNKKCAATEALFHCSTSWSESSVEPEQFADQDNGGKQCVSELVVTGCDGAQLFELADEARDDGMSLRAQSAAGSVYCLGFGFFF